MQVLTDLPPDCIESGAIGLGRIIDEWQRGCEVKGLTFWGQEVIWWARWGKGMQFLAGLVFVLDLIGPERFEATSGRLKSIAKGTFRLLERILTAIFSGMNVRVFFGLLVLLTSLVAFFMYLVIFLGAIFMIVFGLLVLLSWMVRFGKHGKLAQWLAVVLVIAGFSFDMFGS